MNTNDAFKNYATSSAFHISLSSNQVTLLLNLAYDLKHKDLDYALAHRACKSHATWHAVARKGLIRHDCKTKQRAGLNMETNKVELYDATGFDYFWEITKAGHAILPLLKLAGFVHSFTLEDEDEGASYGTK